MRTTAIILGSVAVGALPALVYGCGISCEDTLSCGPFMAGATSTGSGAGGTGASGGQGGQGGQGASGGQGGAGGTGAGGQGGEGGAVAAITPSIEAGLNATCAILREGETWCWGRHRYGGAEETDVRPTQIPGVAVEIAVGNDHICRRTISGSLECWGQNDRGQLGNNSTNQSITGVPTLGLDQVSSISLGGDTSCAADDAMIMGDLSCWGDNQAEEVPNANDLAVLTPTRAQFDSTLQIDMGADFGCARRVMGVWCWGSNLSGQSDPYTTIDFIRAPQRVALPQLTRDISMSGSSACALMNDQTTSCWGFNGFGGLISGGPAILPVTQIQGLPLGTDIEHGGNYHALLATDGSVWWWRSGATTPVDANLGCFAVDIAAGNQHICALCSDDTVYCWGSVSRGQLGNGTLSDSTDTPIMLAPF